MDDLNSRNIIDSIRDSKVERGTYSIYLGPVWEEFKQAIEADNESAKKEGKKPVSPSEVLETLMELFLLDFRKKRK